MSNALQRNKRPYSQSKTRRQILAPLFLAILVPHMLFAAGPAPINLGTTANFTILAGAGITSTGGGIINGDVGASPIAGSAIGVTDAQVNGTIYAVDSSGPAGSVVDPVRLSAAKSDLTAAYNEAAGRTPIPSGPNLNPGAGNIGGMNLAPGLYKFTSTANITGSDLTLTGGPDDVWIFQCAADLQLGSGIKVILVGGAQASHIFWQVGTSAVLGTGSTMQGTIMADQSITMNTTSTLVGRALAFEAGIVYNGLGASVPAPEIGVEQPAGVDVIDGVGARLFGSVPVGSDATLIFTITNSGSADLTNLNITIDGAQAAMFSVTVNPTSPVHPGTNTTFTVRFSPSSTGVKNAALHIANNDSDENPFDILLSGIGTSISAPEIGVSQPPGNDLIDGVSTSNFGFVAVGTNASLTFTITNSGSADLTGLAITINGADAGMFTVTTNPVAPVAPGGSTIFVVRFTPGSTNVKTAALHIANNDSNENPFDINLTGTGTATNVAPEIGVSQPAGSDLIDGISSRDFGSVAVGTNSTLTFTITNSGTANLLNLSVSINGADAAMFSISTNPAASVTPNGRTTFIVRFAPGSIGLKTAALHIGNNDNDENPFDITVTGTGIAGVIVPITNALVTVLSPITLNPQTGLFEQTVRVTNAGTNTIESLRLLILALPVDVLVHNASGTTNGTPYVQYNLPLAPLASVDFLIEYYRANRQIFPTPTFVAQSTISNSVPVSGNTFAVDRFVAMPDGRFLLEFTAIAGRHYAVQYSSNTITWKTASPTITAPSNRVQWYDDGPPKTESKPTTVGSRYYRVVALP